MIGFVKKIGMSRIFVGDKIVPVTALLFDTNYVLQTKTLEKDNYQAVQIGAYKKSKSDKAILGHISKYSELDHNLLQLGEFEFELPEDKKTIEISDFTLEDKLNISGITKGKGFAGAVKRYHFRGQPASHGHDHKRAVGSIGARWPQRTLPGKKMAGRMGNVTRTVQNQTIVGLDLENKLIFIQGSVPGANGNYLKIQKIIKLPKKTKLIKTK